MGMMGMFIVHRRDPRSGASIATSSSSWRAISSIPGHIFPKVNEMTDFNMWTWK